MVLGGEKEEAVDLGVVPNGSQHSRVSRQGKSGQCVAEIRRTRQRAWAFRRLPLNLGVRAWGGR